MSRTGETKEVLRIDDFIHGVRYREVVTLKYHVAGFSLVQDVRYGEHHVVGVVNLNDATIEKIIADYQAGKQDATTQRDQTQEIRP